VIEHLVEEFHAELLPLVVLLRLHHHNKKQKANHDESNSRSCSFSKSHIHHSLLKCLITVIVEVVMNRNPFDVSTNNRNFDPGSSVAGGLQKNASVAHCPTTPPFTKP